MIRSSAARMGFTLDVGAARLARANLEGADLSHAKADGVDFRLANLKRSKLRSTRLKGANLSGADLSGADLTNADLEDANLSGCKLFDVVLEGANLRGADLTKSEGLTPAALKTAVGDHTTRLPTSVERPAAWDAPTHSGAAI